MSRRCAFDDIIAGARRPAARIMTAPGNLPEWLLYGLGTLLSLAALRMLWQPGRWRALAWAVGWVGMATAGALSLLAAADFGRYRSLVPGAVIATIDIEQQTADPGMVDRARGSSRVHIATRGGWERDVMLSGNHWIFDVQTIRCLIPLCPVHLYRGRHFYAARAQSGDALPGYDTVAVGDSDSLLDVWYWLARVPRLRGLVRVTETATGSLPVRDGAKYEIRIDAEGRLRTTDIGIE